MSKTDKEMNYDDKISQACKIIIESTPPDTENDVYLAACLRVAAASLSKGKPTLSEQDILDARKFISDMGKKKLEILFLGMAKVFETALNEGKSLIEEG